MKSTMEQIEASRSRLRQLGLIAGRLAVRKRVRPAAPKRKRKPAKPAAKTVAKAAKTIKRAKSAVRTSKRVQKTVRVRKAGARKTGRKAGS